MLRKILINYTCTMTKITPLQYEEALDICQQYRAQINAEVAKIEPITIAEFIMNNLISRRLNNVLHYAMDKGYVYVSELTENNLKKIVGCGKRSIQEFQLLTNK